MDVAGILRDFAKEKPLAGKVKESLRVNLDPVEAAKIHIKTKLANDVAYRTSILSNVKTLATLEPEDMRKACETMEEQRYTKGEDIIRQGEKGDSLYLLQTGSVVITRKVNPVIKVKPLPFSRSCLKIHISERLPSLQMSLDQLQ